MFTTRALDQTTTGTYVQLQEKRGGTAGLEYGPARTRLPGGNSVRGYHLILVSNRLVRLFSVKKSMYFSKETAVFYAIHLLLKSLLREENTKHVAFQFFPIDYLVIHLLSFNL